MDTILIYFHQYPVSNYLYHFFPFSHSFPNCLSLIFFQVFKMYSKNVCILHFFNFMCCSRLFYTHIKKNPAQSIFIHFVPDFSYFSCTNFLTNSSYPQGFPQKYPWVNSGHSFRILSHSWALSIPSIQIFISRL